MKRKVLSIALILCMMLGTFGVSFGVESESWKRSPYPEVLNAIKILAATKDKVVAFGEGSSGFGVEIFDTNTETWTYAGKMLASKDLFKAVSVGEKIYVIGGRDKGVAVSSMESYNITTGVWETERSMVIPRDGADAVVVGDKIYVVGGYNNKCVGALEIYDTKTGK